MLCVLREDFLLELYGITNDRLERLDDNDSGFRRTYFWRNTLRTLEEIKNVLNRLNTDPGFRAAMLREPPVIQQSFKQLKRELNKASRRFLLNLRNTMGGHLDEPTIQAALDSMDPLQEGLIQVGPAVGSIHYNFSQDILWAALLVDVPERDYDKKVNELLAGSSRLNRTLLAMDYVVNCYFRDRGLP
jgi:hypothetical protein